MSDQLRVDLEQFRGLVSRFENLGTQTLAARLELTQGLDGEGECWGADEVGTAFASKYVAASEDTIDVITLLAQIFDLIGEKVSSTADPLDTTDTAFSGRLFSVHPDSGV